VPSPVRREFAVAGRVLVGTVLLVSGAAAGWGGTPGTGARATEPAPLDAFFLAIATTSLTVDAGVPFTMTADVLGAFPPLVYLWSSPAFGTSRNASWTVVLPTPGSATVALAVADAASDLENTTLTLVATPPPALTAAAASPVADVGVPIAVSLAIAGGVPPYTLAWSMPDGTGNGSIVVDAPATVVVPVTPSVTGPAWFAATAVDFVGGRTAIAAPVGTVSAPLVLDTPTLPVAGEVGVPVAIGAVAVGGAPPVEVAVSVDGPVEQPLTNVTGPLPTTTIQWSGTFPTSGNWSGWIVAHDGTNTSVVQPIALAIVPALSVGLVTDSIRPPLGGPLNLTGLVTGGVPPYAFAFTLSDGERAVGNLSGAGTVSWLAGPVTSGYLTITLTVRDALGIPSIAVGTVQVAGGSEHTAPAPLVGTGSPAVLAAAGAAGVAVGALGMFVVLRRLRHPVPAGPVAPADPGTLDTIRRLLLESDGLDRESLDYLAQEEGLTPEQIDRAVDAAITDGRIHREEESEGGRLVWGPSPPAVPATPERIPPDEAPP